MNILAIAVALALDPLLIIGGIVSGFLIKNVRDLAIAALCLGVLHEWALMGLQYTRELQLLSFAIGTLVCFAYGYGTMLLRAYLKKRAEAKA